MSSASRINLSSTRQGLRVTPTSGLGVTSASALHVEGESILKIIQLALTALAFALSTTAAAQDLQIQLIGTWDFVVAQVKAPDGKISFPFGESPKGMLIFTPDGRF